MLTRNFVCRKLRRRKLKKVLFPAIKSRSFFVPLILHFTPNPILCNLQDGQYVGGGRRGFWGHLRLLWELQSVSVFQPLSSVICTSCSTLASPFVPPLFNPQIELIEREILFLFKPLHHHDKEPNTETK